MQGCLHGSVCESASSRPTRQQRLLLCCCVTFNRGLFFPGSRFLRGCLGILLCHRSNGSGSGSGSGSGRSSSRVRLSLLPCSTLLRLQVSNVALSNSWGNAGQEQQPRPLEPSYMVEEPVSVGHPALCYQSGRHPTRIRASGLAGGTGSVVPGGHWRGRLDRFRVRSVGVCQGDQALQVLAEGLPGFVGKTSKHARIQQKHDGCDGRQGQPSGPGGIVVRKPPNEHR